MRPTVRQVMAEVAAEHRLPVATLSGRDQTRKATAARHQAMVRTRAETTLSLPAIGKVFGRHHTTVLSALQRAAAVEGRP